jgi:hypothetical protein
MSGSRIRDNRPEHGSAGNYLKDHIEAGSELSFVSAYFRSNLDNPYTIRPRTTEYSLQCLVVFLNSSVLRWYYRKVVNPETGNALVQVKKGHLERFPIPEGKV